MYERKITYIVLVCDRKTDELVKKHELKNTDLKMMRRLFSVSDPDEPMWGLAYPLETPEHAAYFEKLLGEKIDLKKRQYTFEADSVDWKPEDRRMIVHTLMWFKKGKPHGEHPNLHDVENPDLPAIRKLLAKPDGDPLQEKTPVPPAAAPYFEKLTNEKFDFAKYDYFFGAEVRYADA